MAEHPRTKQILEKLNNTTVIEIDHYKDVFCRKKQSISAQSNAKALILAENTSGCIYEVHRCVRALEMRISTIAHA